MRRRQLGAVLVQLAIEQSPGERPVNADMLLSGDTGGGDFPAHRLPTAKAGERSLGRITIHQRLRAAGLRQAVNAALALPILPD